VSKMFSEVMLGGDVFWPSGLSKFTPSIGPNDRCSRETVGALLGTELVAVDVGPCDRVIEGGADETVGLCEGLFEGPFEGLKVGIGVGA